MEDLEQLPQPRFGVRFVGFPTTPPEGPPQTIRVLIPGPQKYVKKQPKTTKDSLKGHYSTCFWGQGIYSLAYLFGVPISVAFQAKQKEVLDRGCQSHEGFGFEVVMRPGYFQSD